MGDLKEEVFLLISTLEISQRQLSLLEEMYQEMLQALAVRKQHSHKFIWVWIPVVNADKDAWLQTYKLLVESMPWAVIKNPWPDEQLSDVASFFRETIGFCETPLLVRFRPGIGIYPTDLIPTLATLGSEEFLFSIEEGFAGIDLDEGDNAMNPKISNLDILFQRLPEILKGWRGSQKIYLYGGDHEMISEFNQKLLSVSKEAKIVFVGRRHFLRDNGREKEDELYKQDTDSTPWLKLSYSEVKCFWNRVHYLVSLVSSVREFLKHVREDKVEALKKNREREGTKQKLEGLQMLNPELKGVKEKLDSLQRLLLCLLSLDCQSRRNGAVWMMAIDATNNQLFTGKGKELVDLVSSYTENVEPYINIGSGVVEVYPIKTQQIGEELVEEREMERDLVEIDMEVEEETRDAERKQQIQVMSEEEKITFEDAPWLTVHDPSHLIQNLSDSHCSMCYFETPSYQCDTCQCFYICQKCYIAEFVGQSKNEVGEQI